MDIPANSNPVSLMDQLRNNPSQVDQSQYFGSASHLSDQQAQRLKELEDKASKGTISSFGEQQELNQLRNLNFQDFSDAVKQEMDRNKQKK